MINYETAEIAKRKANFIKENGLGGTRWWETSGDKEGEGSLIPTVGSSVFAM
jgi:chitinase